MYVDYILTTSVIKKITQSNKDRLRDVKLIIA